MVELDSPYNLKFWEKTLFLLGFEVWTLVWRNHITITLMLFDELNFNEIID